MTRAEKHAAIMRLRALGWSRADVAAELGMSVSGIDNLICDPDGSKQRTRRKRYQGVCETCGAATTGCNGRVNAPRFCANCAPDAYRMWTRDQIIAAIRRWASEHGCPPVATDWQSARPANAYWPYDSTVSTVFGCWANGIEAAGFARPLVGQYQKTQRGKREAIAA